MELVEREKEIDGLLACLRIAARGSGRMVLLGGEAGIGKTSLLQALADRRDDALLWWGACDALQTPHPLAPLHDIARSSSVGFRGLMSAETDRAALFEAVLNELQHSRRPVLVVIEDVHWADDATMDLIKFLGRRIGRVACLLVVSFRDDQLTAAHPLRRLIGQLPPAIATRIDVPRLSPAAVELLARRALQSAEGLHATTQGNPFFVTEVLRHGGEPVPRAVQDLVLARYTELDAQAQAVLRLASVVPVPTERWLVERLIGEDVAPIEACLGSGLVISGAGSALGYRHELARTAVESSLAEPLVRSLHAAVLEALCSDKRAQVSLARLVHHAVRADDHQAVMQHAPQAAEEARQRGAWKEAAAHYAVALRHAEVAGVDDDAARMARWLDGYAGGCERSDQLEELIAARWRLDATYQRMGNVTERARNLSQLAKSLPLTLRFEEAQAANRLALALLDTVPPGPVLAWTLSVQATLCGIANDDEGQLRCASQALELAERFGERETALLATKSLGMATIRSDFDAGRAHLLRAIDMGLAEGRDFAVADLLSALAHASCDHFRWADAQAVLDRAFAFCGRDEYERTRAYDLALYGHVDVHLGRWESAVDRAQKVLVSDGWSTSRFWALLVLGRVQARRGDAQAAATLDAALSLAPTSVALRGARAEAAWLRGDTASVIDEARQGLALAGDRSTPWYASELAYWLHRAGAADAEPARGATPYALQIGGDWAAAAEAWAAIGCPYEQARALAEGDDGAALRAWRLFDGLGARPAADAVRAKLGKAARRLLPRVARPETASHPFALTAREAKVLSLLCAGLKNAAIAERLVRSVRTVDHHVASIYAKLGVGSRSEAVAAALRAGIGGEE